MIGSVPGESCDLQLRVLATTTSGEELLGHVHIKLEGLLATQDHEFEQPIMNRQEHIGRIALSVQVPAAAMRVTRAIREASRMQEVAALCVRDRKSVV